jgi:hypothetical protein
MFVLCMPSQLSDLLLMITNSHARLQQFTLLAMLSKVSSSIFLVSVSKAKITVLIIRITFIYINETQSIDSRLCHFRARKGLATSVTFMTIVLTFSVFISAVIRTSSVLASAAKF